ncbi:hypothetical protein DFH28DRAFT_985127 [Melampsora americana]|nr:hypothetical protein DFH28DRAFT_985127 [Melampsora americana]
MFIQMQPYILFLYPSFLTFGSFFFFSLSLPFYLCYPFSMKEEGIAILFVFLCLITLSSE